MLRLTLSSCAAFYKYCFFYTCRQLCILLNAEHIYLTLSEILVIYNDARFSCQMVHTLNSILLTSTELFELRNQLKELKTEVIKLVILIF